MLSGWMAGEQGLSRSFYLLLTLVRSLDAISFVLLSFLCIRDYRVRRTRWGGGAYCALMVAYAIVYLNVLPQEAIWLVAGHSLPWLDALEMAVSLLVAPLMFHAFYNGERQHLPARRVWKTWLGLSYGFAVSGAIGGEFVTMGVLRNPLPVNTPSAVRLWHLSNIVFAAAGIVAILCASRRTSNSPAERRQRRWVLALCVAWMCVRVAWRLTDAPWLVLLKDTCPLVFIFLVTYYVERIAFFDVLIKKGVLAFFSISLLSIYFTWVTPWMEHFRLGILVWALSAWPIVLLNPWLQRRLSTWIDRLWLGRRFSPIEASERFLDGLQGAISEPELAGLAELRLRTIFQSEAAVQLDPAAPAGEADGRESMRAPICLRGEQVGFIHVRRRVHNPRFLSEDVALLGSLAGIFSFLLENLRLREKRLEQEKREQQLLLYANRSELKALRAQVNPHFLFNALNTIASLIPRQPDRAEQTIEQLAELFRYTLRRSDREWVTLEEELEVVRAYLDVEQARFGDHLATRIEASGEARQMRIPAMIVQTLVENAVKHGAGRIRTQGVVEVNATVSASGLRIAVGDNGPGFPAAATRAFPPGNGGYGLRNIRERLQAHFGEAASLTVDRDTTQGMTVVSLCLPLAVPQPAEARAQ